MSNPLLSILIPSTPDRSEECNSLLKELERQCNNIADIGVYDGKVTENIFTHYFHNGVDATVYIDEKVLTIGEKRGILYGMANGAYSWQIDSDDSIAPNAIELILQAIKENPDVDCITFEENCQMNGKCYKSNHSLEYPDWYGDGSHLLHDGFHFHRTPFYKDVIKTEIAKSVPFRHIRYGEDHLWSIDLKPHLKTEVHIPKELYYYIHEPKDTFEERYGINK